MNFFPVYDVVPVDTIGKPVLTAEENESPTDNFLLFDLVIIIDYKVYYLLYYRIVSINTKN